MPYDSLVALGDRHPQFIAGGEVIPPIGLPLQCMEPVFPGGPPALAIDLDQYLGPSALPPEERQLLQLVTLDPATVSVHPSWRNTAVGLAMDEEDSLALAAVTPAMMRDLPEVTRKSFLEMLSCVDVRVSWVDAFGHKHKRQPLLWMPIGKRWKVNGASALALCMAADPDPTALRQVLFDGLTSVVEQLHGAGSRAKIFTAEDVSWVLQGVIEKVRGNPTPMVCHTLPCAPGGKPHPGITPQEAHAELNAAAMLVERYLQQVAREDPSAMREAIQRLMQAMATNMPVDAAHMGLGLGLILAGAFRYTDSLGAADFRARWRVATVANMIWVSQNFVPFWFISGPVAAVAVATGIWWDYTHPPRDYTDIVRRFDSEYMLLALRGELVLEPLEVSQMQLWMRQVLSANNFAG